MCTGESVPTEKTGFLASGPGTAIGDQLETVVLLPGVPVLGRGGQHQVATDFSLGPPGLDMATHHRHIALDVELEFAGLDRRALALVERGGPGVDGLAEKACPGLLFELAAVLADFSQVDLPGRQDHGLARQLGAQGVDLPARAQCQLPGGLYQAGLVFSCAAGGIGFLADDDGQVAAGVQFDVLAGQHAAFDVDVSCPRRQLLVRAQTAQNAMAVDDFDVIARVQPNLAAFDQGVLLIERFAVDLYVAGRDDGRAARRLLSGRRLYRGFAEIDLGHQDTSPIDIVPDIPDDVVAQLRQLGFAGSLAHDQAQGRVHSGRIVHELAHHAAFLVDAALGLGAHQTFGLAPDQGAVEIIVAADVDALPRGVADFLEKVARSVELRLIDKADPGFVIGRGHPGRLPLCAPEEKGIGQGVVQGSLEIPVMPLVIGLTASSGQLLRVAFGLFARSFFFLRLFFASRLCQSLALRFVVRSARVLFRRLARLGGPGRGRLAALPVFLRLGDSLLQRRVHRIGQDIGDVLAIDDLAFDVGAEAPAEHGLLVGIEGQVLAAIARLELGPAPRAVRVAQAAPIATQRAAEGLGQDGRAFEVAAGQAIAQPAVFVFIGDKYRAPARVLCIFVVIEHVVQQVVQRGKGLRKRVEDGQVVLCPHLRAGYLPEVIRQRHGLGERGVTDVGMDAL